MLYRRFNDDKTNMSPGRFTRVGVVTVLMSHDLAGLVTTGAVQVLARQDGQVTQVTQVGQSVSSTVTASASAGRMSQLPDRIPPASPRLHAISPPKVSWKLETESFTLLHLGGLINRPVQIVGG
jgi:hypothetical protein